jgi:hypothetical protein
MLRKIPSTFVYWVFQKLTSISNDYAKLLAGRVHEEKAKRDELRKRRASSMRK